MDYLVREYQDLLDVSIQEFGNLEDGLFKILTDNPTLNLNSKLSAAQKIQVDPTDLGNLDIKEFFSNKSFVVVNVDEAAIFEVNGDYNNDYNDDFNNQ
ncbi:MAG: hypothetical protein ACQ9ET_00270 [Nitrosomonadaceae bacterium]